LSDAQSSGDDRKLKKEKSVLNAVSFFLEDETHEPLNLKSHENSRIYHLYECKTLAR
jgi:hypothetical protein